MDSWLSVLRYFVPINGTNEHAILFDMFSPYEFQDLKTLQKKIESMNDLDKKSLEFLSEQILREHFHSPQYMDQLGTTYLFNASFEDLVKAKGKLERIYSEGREPIAKLGPKGLLEVNPNYSPNLGFERSRFLINRMSQQYRQIESQVLLDEL